LYGIGGSGGFMNFLVLFRILFDRKKTAVKIILFSRRTVGADDSKVFALWVKAIMLHYKTHIVENHHYSKKEFDDVNRNILTKNCLQGHLQEGKQSTSQIKKYIENRPSSSGFTLVIPIELR